MDAARHGRLLAAADLALLLRGLLMGELLPAHLALAGPEATRTAHLLRRAIPTARVLRRQAAVRVRHAVE